MRKIPSLALAAAVIAASAGPLRAQEPPPEKTQQRPPQTAVVPLQYAVADELVPLLQHVLPATSQRTTRISADPRTNALVISAEDADHANLKALIGALDRPAAPGKAPTAAKSANFEIGLMMIKPGQEDALSLARTSLGAIDPADPDALLAKLREGVAKGLVVEVARLSVTSDEGRPWKSEQQVQVPMTSDVPGGPKFAGYAEAEIEFGVTPQTGKDGARRLAIACRIERFGDGTKADLGPATSSVPLTKHRSMIEFTTAVADGKLAMAAVESSVGGSYVLFVRVKS
jgi:hypothetical protein